MDKIDISYGDGEPVCEYEKDRQRIYYDRGEWIEYAMEGDLFTRESVHYKNNAPAALTLITSVDRENATAEAINYVIRKGEKIPRRKVSIDYRNGIEMVSHDMEGNSIAAISRLDKKNYSTLKTTEYYPSRNLKSICQFKTNIPHQAHLSYYNSRPRVPKGQLCDTKYNLATCEIYDMGFIIKKSFFGKNGQLDYELLGTKQSPDDDIMKDYSYTGKDGLYSIEYSNTEYLYKKNTFKNGLLNESSRYDAEGRLIYTQRNRYEEPFGADPILAKQNHYFPESWDQDGHPTSGLIKRYKMNVLDSVVPFIKINNDIVYHGLRIFKDGKTSLYNQGSHISSQQHEVIHQQNNLLIKNPTLK